jgi:hypothetical protein
MMRGFVTEVRRDETMTPSGPDRSVTITGHDYGKILQVSRITYKANQVLGQRLLSYFKLFVNYGVGAKPDQDASGFVKSVLQKVINPFLADMFGSSTGDTSPIMTILADTSVTGGLVSPMGVNAWPGGTIYDLLSYYGDVGPWNELFIEDRSDGPYLVYRPNPFKDPSGGFIQAGASPTVVPVTDKELVALSATRTDAAVANYYWVQMQNYALVDDMRFQVTAATAEPDSIYLDNYPNSDPKLYGFREMEIQTQQGPRVDGQKQSDIERANGVVDTFLGEKRRVIRETNRDNVVFEAGGMRLRGNENVKAGTIISLTRGHQQSAAEYYAVAVSHTFVPFQSYMTAVEFERGTGFIKRIQENAGAGGGPYLTETNLGGVYG